MKNKLVILTAIVMMLVFTACGGSAEIEVESYESETVETEAAESEDSVQSESQGVASVSDYLGEDIPETTSQGWVEINGNEPEFDEEELSDDSYEEYSPLDSLGRCGPAFAILGRDLMPDEDRESISHVYPSGWVSSEYDTDLVEGGYLYNRSHLIGFQLAGENDNERNLITGTRYMNAHVMLPFENMIADYVRDTGNHVAYRVTPIFEGSNLVASGVQMEAMSVEDYGDDICFNVYVYNQQPGIEIDYATGENWLSGESKEENTEEEDVDGDYVLNTNTEKFHDPDCRSVDDMSEINKDYYSGSRNALIDGGYTPCGNCNP